MTTKPEKKAADAAEAFRQRWTPKLTGRLEPDRQIARLRFTPCGKFLLGGGYDGTVWRWQYEEPPQEENAKQSEGKSRRRGVPEAPWRPLERFKSHGGWVTALEVHPQGGIAFSADSWGRLCAWGYEGPQEPKPRWQQPQAHDGWITDMALSPDGRHLATAGVDGTVALWETGSGKLLRRLEGHGGSEVLAVAFHPRGDAVVSGDLFGRVLHWEFPSGRKVRELDASVLYKLHRLQDCGGVRVLRFAPDGKRLAVAGTRPNNGATIQGVPTVLLFDWESGKPHAELSLGPKNECFVCDLLFHEAGFLAVATSGTPGTGRLHLHREGEEKPFFTARGPINCHALARHPKWPLLVVAGTNSGSNGNGRQLRNGKYVGNHSPLFFFQWASEG